jgi:hypothetical protein
MKYKILHSLVATGKQGPTDLFVSFYFASALSFLWIVVFRPAQIRKLFLDQRGTLFFVFMSSDSSRSGKKCSSRDSFQWFPLREILHIKFPDPVMPCACSSKQHKQMVILKHTNTFIISNKQQSVGLITTCYYLSLSANIKYLVFSRLIQDYVCSPY